MKCLGLSLLAILATCVPLLASCVAPTPVPTLSPQPVEPVATEMPILRDPVRLTFWHTEPEGSPAARLLEDFADRFQRECPWITVAPAYVGDYDDLHRKGLAAIHAGHPPDLATAYPVQIADFMYAGALAPLEPYAADDEIGLSEEDRGDFFPGFWELGRFPEFANQLLSLPYAASTLGLYYNLTALQKAGREAPPRTWEEFEQACQATSKGDVTGYAWVESATTFDAWLYSRGAVQLGDGQTRAAFNGPEGVDALELLNRLLASRSARRPSGTHGDRALFAAGKAAFTIDSTADVPVYAAAIQAAGQSFAWGCTLIPQQDPTRPRTAAFGPGLCVFKTGEARQQAAWRFIRWFTSTAQAAEWASALGYAPIRRSAAEELATSGWLDERPVASQVYEAVLPHAMPEPNVRGELEVRRYIEDAWLASALGGRTPQEALDEAAGKANEALTARK